MAEPFGLLMNFRHNTVQRITVAEQRFEQLRQWQAVNGCEATGNRQNIPWQLCRATVNMLYQKRAEGQGIIWFYPVMQGWC